jgi:hypothetical protein
VQVGASAESDADYNKVRFPGKDEGWGHSSRARKTQIKVVKGLIASRVSRARRSTSSAAD